MTRPHIGSLRHRLVIEAPNRTPDGGGGVTENWLPLAHVWGSLEPSSGVETVIAEGVSSRVTHVVHIRHRSDLAPAMRLRLGTRVLDIIALIDIDERRRHLKCLCSERDL